MCSFICHVPDVSPHLVLRSGQPCPLDWLAPSPTTVAAQVSCRALRPKDEWCDLSRAGVPRGWEPGSSCCWGSACCCCLGLIPDLASFGPSHTYLRSNKAVTTWLLWEVRVNFYNRVSESKRYHRRNLKLYLNQHTVATLHKTKAQSDYNSSDNRIHIRSQYPVIIASISFLIQSSGLLYKSHPDFERQAYTWETN